MARQHIGILGGSFDPIHFGHLRTALELVEQADMDELLLIPCGLPPHKDGVVCSPRDRLHMVELAVAGDEHLRADSRECDKTTPSYTVETLQSLREEYGCDTAISLCVGTDAFLHLSTWYQWEKLLELANIVVMARPGWHLPENLGELESWRSRMGEEISVLRDVSCGQLCFIALTPVAVSATEIREMLAVGRSPRYLVPDSVWQYIEQQGLYQ